MSRRAITVAIVILGVIVLANIVILAIWLPARKNSATKPETAATTTTLVPPASGAANPPAPAQLPGGFALERQVVSVDGNLRIKYFRDRQSKMRRITVEDAHNPEANAVLYESKNNAWVYISPDDQWIALDERAADGGGARLFHRGSNSPLRYDPADGSGGGGHDLADAVWKVYLNATHTDPKTPRSGVTVDATGWEKDSRKLNVSVAFLTSASKPDVPEPWSCSYDVASKKVEPNPDQPTAGPENADASAANQGANEMDKAPEQGASPAANDDGNVLPPAGENEVANDDELPGERFPGTRLDQLIATDVDESSLSDITYAINEMYARHGAEFKDKQVTKEFSEFPWYEPRPGVTLDQIGGEFTDLEKANLKVLTSCRDAKLAAANSKPHAVHGKRVHEESPGAAVRDVIRSVLPGN